MAVIDAIVGSKDKIQGAVNDSLIKWGILPAQPNPEDPAAVDKKTALEQDYNAGVKKTMFISVAVIGVIVVILILKKKSKSHES